MKNDWKFVYSEANSLIANDAFFSGFTDYDLIPGMLRKILYIYRKGVHTCYTSSSEYPRLKAQGKVFFSKKYRREFVKEIGAVQGNFEKYYLEFLKHDLHSSNNDDLLQLFREYIKHLKLMFAYYQVSGGRCFLVVEERIKRLLRKYFKENEIEEVYALLLTPTKISKLEKEQIALRKLSESPIDDVLLLQHSKNFALIFINIYDQKLILDSLKKRIRTFRKDKISSKQMRKDIEKQKIQVKKLQNNLYRKISNNLQIIQLCDFLREQGWIRFEYKEWKNGAEYKFLPLFHEISRRARLDLKQFMLSYRIKDVENFLKSGETVPTKERNDRIRISVFYKDGNNRKFLSGKAAEKFQSQVLKINRVSTQELKGITAQTGKATGKARVFLPTSWENLSKQIQQFKSGEILVTTMTEPNLIVAMKKAAAIVTNQGGMTSHAAIVSRELRIPCVVGTMRATELIKTGDLVEVDADKGIVKKI